MSNLVWSWRNAAFGALVVICRRGRHLGGEVENGLYLLIGALQPPFLVFRREQRPTESDGHRSALRRVRDRRLRPG